MNAMEAMPIFPALPTGLATRAHKGTSFVPERRGKAHEEEFAAGLAEDWKRLAARCKSDAELAVLREQFERYALGYRSKYVNWLCAKSRCVSWMIAGPSNFPVRRMEKRNRSEHNRLEELIGFRERALNAIRKVLWPEDNGIATSDPNAPALVRKKIEQLEALQEKMKAANKLVRAFCLPAESRDQAEAEMRPGKSKEELIFKLVALGMSAQDAGRLMVPDFCGRIGFADYEIKNNNANIRRYKGRLTEVSAYQEIEHKEEERPDGVKVVENPEAGRIQLVFPGKPAHAVREILKRNGFRWAPSEGAWQRHLNNAGRSAVSYVLGEIEKQKAPQVQPAAAPDQGLKHWEKLCDREAGVSL